MSKQWFILSTFTGKETEVANALNKWRESNEDGHEFIGEVLLPEVKEESKANARAKTIHTRVVFPGYAFAELDVFEDFASSSKRKEIWDAVCKIDGMIGFLGGDSPRPMSEDEIASVRKYFDEKTEVKKTVELKEGDSVKILDGAFAGNIGTISKICGDVATVSVEIFGEETEQEIALGSLEKVEE